MLSTCSCLARDFGELTPFHMQALDSRNRLSPEAVAAGADAEVVTILQVSADEYKQELGRNSDSGLTITSIKNAHAKHGCVIASTTGGDKMAAMKANLTVDPAVGVKAILPQTEALLKKGSLLLEHLNGDKIWGEVQRLYVKYKAIIVADWPALLALSGLGEIYCVEYLFCTAHDC
jgi:hypothetical protein